MIHRGENEPSDFPPVEHLHVDRENIVGRRNEITAFGAEAFVDTGAMSAADATLALQVIPDGVRAFVLSSADVYRAYEGLHKGVAIEPVPLTEESPVRENRYPYRGKIEGMDDYEKLDVEEAYSFRNATILRLPFVYGEHDYQRREDFVLRRIRAGRTRLPFGVGNFLGTRGYVRDIARGVRLAIESSEATGHVLNLAEPMTLTMRQLTEAIIGAAGANLELVQVQDSLLPPDLRITGTVPQHFLIDSSKARRLLGWQCEDLSDSLRSTVHWHMANPPRPDEDFSADDLALKGT